MDRLRFGDLVALLVTLTMAVTVDAKGPTVRLTIVGPGLSHPIEITDPAAIVQNVWGGEFIGRPATKPDRALPRYVVSFYVKPPREQVRMMYVVQYAWDPITGDGLVYLPGRGEEWYSLNVSTIFRDGQDVLGEDPYAIAEALGGRSGQGRKP